jgi:endonuclease/exonuclease/phosphatase family metal-dependent hydrolase
MTAPLRIATYNVEWFNALFDDDGRLMLDDAPSARYKTTRGAQLRALGTVFQAMDADAVMIIEGPDTTAARSSIRALETFAGHWGLRARRAVTGFASGTEQEICFLFDPDKMTVLHDPKGSAETPLDPTAAPRFDGTFHFDVDQDGIAEPITFSKPPLELALTLTDGTPLRVIGVHAKSKAPHGARNDADVVRMSVENRHKQLAQCIWLRRRVEAHLASGDALIVMGDFNDGPGLDEYEALFGRSGVEVVLGEAGTSHSVLYDPHASMALAQRIGPVPTTARFYLAPKKRYFEALLDFIMVSSDLAARRPAPDWRIWHPLNDPECFLRPELRDALLTASDHFPVTLDLAEPG